MPIPSPRSSSGFSLVETLIATGILVTALAGVAQLLAVSVRQAREPGARGSAVAAAQAKIEWLRARTFGFGPDGESVTDAALLPSPPGAMAEDVPGYADTLDHDGREAGAGDEGAAWARRWAIRSIDAASADVISIEVCVFRAASLAAVAAEACVFTLRSRQP